MSYPSTVLFSKSANFDACTCKRAKFHGNLRGPPQSPLANKVFLWDYFNHWFPLVKPYKGLISCGRSQWGDSHESWRWLICLFCFSRWWFQIFFILPWSLGEWSELTNIFSLGWNRFDFHLWILATFNWKFFTDTAENLWVISARISANNSGLPRQCLLIIIIIIIIIIINSDCGCNRLSCSIWYKRYLW